MNQWNQKAVTSTIKAYRTGWLGVWDALKSAITGNDRLQVPQDITFSIYAKGDVEFANLVIEYTKK